MLRYLRLRIPQLLLIISVALPLALVFSFCVTSTGMLDTGTFVMVFTGCTAVMWGGLALYTRDTDRRRHLPDVLMTYVQCGNTTISMKQSEKADIVWQVLQDDALYRKQVRMWGNGLCLMTGKAFIWLPAVLLFTICLMFWFLPGDVVRLIKAAGEADQACVVYMAANLLFTLFVVTVGLAGILHMLGKKEEELVCFRAAYQERVFQWVSGQQETEDEMPASNEAVLNDGEPK